MLSALFVLMPIISQELVGTEAQKRVEGSSVVKLDEQTGHIQFIKFNETSLKAGVNQIDMLTSALQLDNSYVLKPSKSFYDTKGNQHIKNQLYYKGIAIEGMVFTSHYSKGVLKSASGNSIKGDYGPIKKYVDANSAIQTAIESVDSKQFNWSDNKALYPEAELLYLPVDEQLILCYKVDVYSLVPLSREYIYLSAETGEVIKRVSRINDTDETGRANTLYSGLVEITTNNSSTEYTLYENSRGNGIATLNLNNGSNYYSATSFVDADNVWDNEIDRAAYDAHFGSEKTFDYFYEKFGRNSIDDNGFALNSYVHYGSNYANAFWDGERMTYGDGDGVEYYPLTSLDIVAHEISHGLTTFTADLIYENEPGALNESFSDIFGVAIDFYANPDEANFLIGEQVNVSGTPFRSMEDPNSLGYPDTYLGNYWYSGTGDYGGVHTNSSVPNYWFYLLCEGGSGTNDNGDVYIINAIGMEAAEAIAYRTLTVYLSRYSSFDMARYYSIQAALDLYGECSNEVVEVTNAWHAVGVGNVFDGAPRAYFGAEDQYSCTAPATILFDNYSRNATNYEWYVNDVLVETNEVLNHEFSAAGDYSIALKAMGTEGCSGEHSYLAENYIKISDEGGPIAAEREPQSLNGGNGGIGYVGFANMYRMSGYADEGYTDFTCLERIDLREGNIQNLFIANGSAEDVYVWLDLNGDGRFEDDGELIFSSLNSTTHSGDIMIPRGSVHDSPLRLRVGSEASGYPALQNGSTDSNYGQYEDYTVYLTANTEAPEADFGMSSEVVLINERVSFEDRSINLPTQWSWTFEGGTPSTSSVQNPQVSFASIGTYTIELTATNEFGSTTISKSINVIDELIMGTDTESTMMSGRLYDSGGASGNYSNSESYQFLIDPDCAKSINITINAFDSESCCDRMIIYDGNTSSAAILGEYRGSLSNLPVSVISSSSEVLITFSSDGSITRSGFELSWTSEEYGDGNPVEAAFTLPEQNIPLNFAYQFEDASLFEPYIWNWNFGDGTSSEEQNPLHSFSSSGEFTVNLSVENCTSSDDFGQVVTVDEAPVLNVSLDTIRVALTSGENLEDVLSVSNGNGGALVFNAQLLDTYQKDVIQTSTELHLLAKVLNYSEGESPYFLSAEQRKFPLSQEYNGVNVAFSGYSFNEYSYLDADLRSSGARTALVNSINYQTAMDTMDVLIIDDMSTWISNDVAFFKTWMSEGGFVIATGDDAHYMYRELFSECGIYTDDLNSLSGSATVIDHMLTDQISNFSIYGSALATLSLSGAAEAIILDANSNVFAAASTFGEGKVLFVCDEVFVYQDYDVPNHTQLFSNAMAWGVSEKLNWISIDEGLNRIERNSAGGTNYEIRTEGLLEGVYIADIKVGSNDLQAGEKLVPLRLDLTGIENIEASSNVYFPKTYVNHSDSAFLVIRNTGTRNLDITSIELSNAEFQINFEAVQVAPRTSISLRVDFLPLNAQFYDETITINSSDFDSPALVVPLRANVVLPPILDVSASIVENLFSDESSERDLVINNQGNSALSVDTIIIEQFSSTQGIVADTNHVDLSGHSVFAFDGTNAINLVAKLWQYGATASYGNIDTTNIDADVLYYSGNYYINDRIADWIVRWVKSGKGLFLDLSTSNSIIQSIAQEAGISFENQYSNNGTTEILSDHAITNGLDQYVYNNAYITLNVEDESHSVIKDTNGNTIVAAAELGEGRIVVSNSNGMFNPNAEQLRLGINAIRWLANKNDWLWLNHYPVDSIASGESHDMKLKFDATALLEGSYNAKVKLVTNDPTQTLMNVDALLNVEGIARSNFMTDTLRYGLVYEGQSKSAQVIVQNTGTKDLVVSDLRTSNNEFEVSTDGFTLAPKAYRTIDVRYVPSGIGEDEAYFIIETNTLEMRDTVVLEAYCFTPPVLSVSPPQFDILMRAQDTQSEAIVIDNTDGGSPLNYNISVSFSDNAYSTGSTLQSIMDSLAVSGQDVSDAISYRYNFIDGVAGNNINDGGGDMFDGGNILNTNYLNSISYSNNTIVEGGAFGPGGAYFTSKLNGLFVLVADLDNVNEFSITGNLGADGSGSVDGSVITTQVGNQNFKAYVKRVYNSGDPSVNHLIIVEDNEEVTHSYPQGTDYDTHIINNLEGVSRMHYLLFAGTSGQYIDDTNMQTIMETYLNVIQSTKAWLTPERLSGSVAAGQSSILDVLVEPYGLSDGHYQASIDFNSNDPVNPSASSVINLEIFNNAAPYLANPIGNKVIYSTYNDVIDLNDVFKDPDNDQLYFTVTSSDNSVVFPVVDNGSELRLTPLANGLASIEIECTDNNWDPVFEHFEVVVQQNQAPVIELDIQNVNLDPSNSQFTLNAGSYFSDPDGDVLTYSVSFSREGIAWNDQGGNVFIFYAQANGSVIVTITADDGRNGSVSQSFVINVKDLATSLNSEKSSALNVYPNPVNDSFTMTMLSEKQVTDIYAVSATGQEFKLPYIYLDGKIQVSASKLKQGVYILKVMLNNEYAIKRIVKK